MNFIGIMISKIKSIFKKEPKMIEAPKYNENKDKREKFADSLKVISFRKKKKIETRTCYGDGLGIQNKLKP